MKKPRVLFLFLSISLFADTSPAQVRAGVDVGSHVSTSRLLQQVRELVALGNRGGGTQSGDKCAAYVARRFKEAGYKPAIIKDPQRLAFTLKSWNLKVLEPHSLKHLIRNEWVGAYSPTVRDTSAHLIYVKDPEKLVPGVARGNALLIDNPPAPREYSDLVKKGIRCLLLASPELEGAYSDWAMISDLPASAKNPVPMFNLSSGNAKALREALADSEDVNIQFAVSAETDSARPKTVTATLEGESSKYYLVCGHGDSDSGGPGADDNASGVSGVLETARVLKALVAAHKLPKPKFSIRFIVWGTEIFSTENYVRLNKDSLKNILGVLNFDEIGTGATRNCLYFESNDVKQNEPLLRLLDSIGVAHAGKRGYWEESTTNPSQGGTDSYVFLSESLRRLRVPDVKIPSVTIYTGAWNELKPLPQTPGWNSKAWKGPRDTVYVDFSAYYHSSLDIPDRTTEKEPFNMTGAVKALSIALTRLAW